MGDNPHVRDNPPVLADEITAFNDSATPADDLNRHPQLQAVGLTLSTGDGIAEWVDGDHPVPTREGGIYDYAAGAEPALISLVGTAHLRRVSVRADDDTDATIIIGDGDTIIVPSGESFDELVPGDAPGVTVEIGGSIRAYYVSWITT